MLSCEITPSLAFVIRKPFKKCFRLFLHELVFVYSNSANSQHNTTHHKHTNATLEQDSKTCLPVNVCVDFSVVNCVQKSPQSNIMPTDITGDKTCMFRTEEK